MERLSPSLHRWDFGGKHQVSLEFLVNITQPSDNKLLGTLVFQQEAEGTACSYSLCYQQVGIRIACQGICFVYCYDLLDEELTMGLDEM